MHKALLSCFQDKRSKIETYIRVFMFYKTSYHSLRVTSMKVKLLKESSIQGEKTESSSNTKYRYCNTTLPNGE